MGQAARNAALAQQEKLLRKADTDAKRLAVADQALAHGDIHTAGLIYARLASTRAPSPSTATAKLALARLQKEAEAKLNDLDKRLKAARRTSPDYVSPGADKATGDMGPTINRANAAQSTETWASDTAVPGQAAREAENLGGSAFERSVDWQVVAAGADGGIVAYFASTNALSTNMATCRKLDHKSTPTWRSCAVSPNMPRYSTN